MLNQANINKIGEYKNKKNYLKIDDLTVLKKIKIISINSHFI